MKKKVKFPPGWNEERVRQVLDHYEKQTEGEAVAEDEAARASCTMVAVPNELVPAVCAFLDRMTKRTKGNGKATNRGPLPRPARKSRNGTSTS